MLFFSPLYILWFRSRKSCFVCTSLFFINWRSDCTIFWYLSSGKLNVQYIRVILSEELWEAVSAKKKYKIQNKYYTNKTACKVLIVLKKYILNLSDVIIINKFRQKVKWEETMSPRHVYWLITMSIREFLWIIIIILIIRKSFPF